MHGDGVRALGPRDLPGVLELLAADPVPHVFIEHRARLTRLEPRWLGGEIWGRFRGRELESLCHTGANLVPAMAGPDALAAFAQRARRDVRRSATILGRREEVVGLWRHLEDDWARPRDERWEQPHLVIDGRPLVDADPLVRRSTSHDVGTLYPACVAMYTEEVGISPEADNGRDLYLARVRQLVGRGWSFARYEEGRVVFKAEVACATPSTAQIQGVYVAPDRRGEGLGTAGMAAVVDMVLRDVAPVVSLYVNAHNTAARAAYERVGFRQTTTFSTLLF